MKITLEIPDDLFEDLAKRTIRIFAETDMIAYKYMGWNWKIKTKACSMCGKCCMNLPMDNLADNFPVVKNGQCVYIKNVGDKWVCGLGEWWRPFGCVSSDRNDPTDYCTVRYREVKD